MSLGMLSSQQAHSAQQQAFLALARNQAQGISGLIGGLGAGAAFGQQCQSQTAGRLSSINERKDIKKDLTIIEELQADTDEWLKDVDI